MNTGLDSLKNAWENVIHKAGKFLGNEVADVVAKSTDDNIEKQEPIEEIIFRWKEEMKY